MATYLNLLSGSSMFLTVIPGIFAWRLYFQKDDQLLSMEKRQHIESKVQELAHKLEISKPVELIEKKGLSTGAQAQGIELFSGRAGIAIDPNLANKMSEAELEFVIAHELSHIKANDLMWMGVVSGLVGVITTLAMSILYPSSATYFSPIAMAALTITSPAALVGISVSMIAFAFFSQWREKCADKLGVSICSNAAQKAAPQFFDGIRTSQMEQRNDEDVSCLSKIWRRILITQDGEARFGILHPSLKNRIEYLRQT